MNKTLEKEPFPYLLPVLFGALATLLYYRFGMWDSVETIALVKRNLDPGYLSGDFLLQARELFHVRYYFVCLLTGLAWLSSVPVAFFGVCLFSNVLLSVASYRTARYLGGEHLAGLLGSALVMSAHTASLSQSAVLFAQMTVPSVLASAFILMGFYHLLRFKVINASLWFIPAFFFQAQYALSAAVLLFVPSFFAYQPGAKRTAPFFWAALILALALLPTLLPYLAMPQLANDDLFIHILAYYRHPHHFVPSFFLSWRDAVVISGLFFFVCAAFHLVGKGSTSPKRLPAKGFIKVFLLLLALAMFAGWFFVEILPQREVVSLQLWRNLDLLKWLYLIVTGVTAGRLIARDGKLFDGMMLAMSLIHIWLSFAAWAVVLSGRWITPAKGFWGRVRWGAKRGLQLLFVLYLLYAIVLNAILDYQDLGNWHLLAVVLLAGLSFYFHHTSVYAAAIFIVLAAIPYFIAFRPYDVDKQRGEVYTIAMKAKEITPEGSLLAIPPGTARMRLIAERPLMVDYRGVVTESQQIAAWHERMTAAYGPVKNPNTMPIQQFKANYRRITDQGLFNLSQEYKAEYAVLYKDTPTGYPVLAESQKFKLVWLPPFLHSANPNSTRLFNARPSSVSLVAMGLVSP
jgi:hypothetical protein